MPIYEYACKLCGHRFDEIQKISDPPLTTCPKCHGDGAQRQISASAFILKGGGWYADGYGLGGGRKSASSSSSKADGAGSSDKGSSDKGSSDKGSSDKGSSDKGSKSSSDKGKGGASSSAGA